MKNRTFLALWGVVLALAAYLGWALRQEHAALAESGRNEALSLARLVAEAADASFQLVDLSLRHAIESMPPVDLEHANRLPETSRQAIEGHLRRHHARTPGVVSMSLTDARGIVIANTVGAVPGSSLADRSYFIDLKESDGSRPVISEAMRGRVSGKWGIQVARRIDFPDGRFAGMLVANLGIEEHFIGFFRTLELGSGAAVSLWNRDRRLLVRYPAAESAVGKNLRAPELDELLRPEQTEAVSLQTSPVDGKRRVAGTRQLKNYPINAVVALDQAAHMAPWQQSLATTLLLLAALFAAAAALSFQLFRQQRADDGLRLAASVFSHAYEGIMITDPQGRLIDVNSQMEEMTGYGRDELIGANPRILNSGHHDPAFFVQLWKSLLEEGSWRGEIWNRRKDGALYAQQSCISAIRDDKGRISHFVGICSDITALKEEQLNLERMAFYDPLTQLPNRILLADRLQQAITTSQRESTLLAVCYLDLDNFKPVNDRYGHAVGDQLLANVANRWRGCVRGGDTVARLGGDEFVILLTGMASTEECEATVTRLLAAMAPSFILGNMTLSISASIGVAIFPRDGTTPEELLNRADTMLYHAKSAGRNRYRFVS